jgi:hypothetical protein
MLTGAAMSGGSDVWRWTIVGGGRVWRGGGVYWRWGIIGGIGGG